MVVWPRGSCSGLPNAGSQVRIREGAFLFKIKDNQGKSRENQLNLGKIEERQGKSGQSRRATGTNAGKPKLKSKTKAEKEN